MRTKVTEVVSRVEANLDAKENHQNQERQRIVRVTQEVADLQNLIERH